MALKFKFLTILIIIAVLVGGPWVYPRQQAHALFGLDAVAAQALEVARLTALETLKRRILTMMTDQIINWIEGREKPLFITDWKRFLGEAANIAIGDLAIDLGAGYLCSPFRFQLQLTILRPPRFTQYVSCTLDDIVSNIKNFYEDFRNGGWFAYAEQWQPQNNYYGSVLMAMEELYRREAVIKEANLFEGLAGGGFIGTRVCDSTGRFCTITTPGAQIGALAAKALGADIDYLVNAQDLAAYVGAIADALINRLIEAGARGLLSLTTPDAPEQGFIRNRGPCAGLRGSALQNCLALTEARQRRFQENQEIFLSEIDATLLPNQAGEERLSQSIARQTELVDALTALRQCQVDKSQPRSIETGEQLHQEQDILNRMDRELFTVRRLINRLTEAKEYISNPPSQDNASITFYFESVAFSLDANEARRFKEDKEQELQQINDKVSNRLPQIEQELQSCQEF